ncbi:class A sortase [Vagococcus xieshaowenii]|uniref:Class A sortase n=1 Tax=Vagococcus xieshaowenii TaxID=2562451 RepID=A0AAJ5JLA3_9ENTE|nr:class A sortase [Vagococcus xieshaowenii]QCA28946.1 class A sortase [Vagococcus xieshaowenii]TFZ39242.1 class A sortase [Vagococcus xieshaowenii]
MTNKQQNNNKHKKNWFINFICFLLLLVGLALIFNKQIQNFLIHQKTNQYQLNNVSLEDIKKNQKGDAEFDFDKVESLDLESVLRARAANEPLPVIGNISVPSVNMNLPIFKGVSNTSLLFGAGTMKLEQAMGQGNYGLASHRMVDPTLLFSPILEIKSGDKIYLTDLDKVYIYEATYMDYIPATKVEVIDDVEDQTLVTLITCDTTGTNRYCVQGELVDVLDFDGADQEQNNIFGLNN